MSISQKHDAPAAVNALPFSEERRAAEPDRAHAFGPSDVGEPAATLYRGPAEDAYDGWVAPNLIVSDGAYGVGGFPGDPRTPDGLDEWYAPHAAAWAAHAPPAATLWFWNTEVGWATVHPVLARTGWEYVQTIVWDKGIAHIAGNVNGGTLRRVPTVTEVCAFYRRRLAVPTPSGPAAAREWLRSEWRRTGLPLYRANEACGVRNAATRKYLTQDRLWYFPPPDMMEALVAYANRNGDPRGRPYFSFDGKTPVGAAEWAALRHPWTHEHGLTNVWSHPPLNGAERYRGGGRRVAPRVHNPGRNAAAHLNQKPLALMRRIIDLASRPGDVVWEPFGGLCTASVAAAEAGRRAFAAEPDPYFAELARKRLDRIAAGVSLRRSASADDAGETTESAGRDKPTCAIREIGCRFLLLRHSSVRPRRPASS